MVACELEQKDANAFPGVTLFTKRQAPGMKPTAVYLPPKHPTSATKFDVVINLKIAKALGLTAPFDLLNAADK